MLVGWREGLLLQLAWQPARDPATGRTRLPQPTTAAPQPPAGHAPEPRPDAAARGLEQVALRRLGGLPVVLTALPPGVGAPCMALSDRLFLLQMSHVSGASAKLLVTGSQLSRVRVGSCSSDGIFDGGRCRKSSGELMSA